MIRKLLVVATAIAMPVSVIAVTGATAGAGGGPSAKTDTAVCTNISGTVTFSIPLTSAGNTTGGVETSTVNATVSGCSASGTFPVALTSGTISGSFSSKPGSVKKPSAKCTGLIGPSKNSGTVNTAWSSVPAVPVTSIKVKTVTGGVDGPNAQFSLSGKFGGSFGGADKGKTSTSVSDTVETTATLLGECAGAGISSLSLKGPSSGNPLVLQ